MRTIFVLLAVAMISRAHWDNMLDVIFSIGMAVASLIIAYMLHKGEVNRPKNLAQWRLRNKDRRPV